MSGKGRMSKDTAVATGETATATLRDPHVRRVVDAPRNSHSASTRRNYRAAWRRFQMWADREGLSALPAPPETVAAYLAERADSGLSPASLRMDRAAIRYRHTEAGLANPADNEGVRRVLRGLTRQAECEGRTPRQAAALTEEGLPRDPCDCPSAAHWTERPNRAGPYRVSPRSGGRSAGVSHAGRHAPALRSCRVHLGRRGVPQ